MPHDALHFLDEMKARGQISQLTAEDHIARAHLTSPRAGGVVRKAYVGFDPTADSLTIGNLVGIMALARFQRCGHTPVAVMGGGTGLIGDPSGKSAERTLNTPETVASNVEKIKVIFDRMLDFSRGCGNAAHVVNNHDWLGKLSYLEALRDIGKHFSVNMMIQKDSVKERLTRRDQGISYTEFSYMILQAYDFAWLHEHMGVTVQMGGSDQFGNIVVGIDLIGKQRTAGPADTHQKTQHQSGDALGLTWPLITKADGGKFGKTETGAIWLSPQRTSPYAYTQFWLNVADADTINFLKTFTFLSLDDIAALEAAQRKDPGAREAQRALAREATTILHGPTEAANALAAASTLFSGEIAGLPHAMLNEVLASAPASSHPKPSLEGDGVAALELLLETKLASSKREAREFLSAGSVSVNGRKIGPDDRLRTTDLLHGEIIALRRGRKQWHVTRWK